MTIRIATIGSGSWGTALSILLARNGHFVHLIGRSPQQIALMQQARCNTRYLPDISFPESLQPTTELQAAIPESDVVLLAVPSTAFRSTLKTIQPWLTAKHLLIWASKGLEPESHKLLETVIQEELGNIPCALLTGPSFAKDVAQGLPTAVVIASRQYQTAEHAIKLFVNPQFRPYFTEDVTGAEIGGAVKNVMAIAAGIADALGLGANSRAALITRGLYEMTQLGVALGAKAETFMGLSGLGDLVLTCTDNLSRNRRFGLALGSGLSKEAAQVSIGQIVEGAENVPQILALAHAHHVEMPITEHVQQVLNGQLTPKAAVASLLARDLRPEYK
jgi:glycerol-3-phosphate dehydrogenase (NAD(P)+)